MIRTLASQLTYRPRAAGDAECPIIQWPHEADEPPHYWFCNLPKATSWQRLIDTVMGRWRIERDYQELKQELGLGHYEGRNWRGFHHHASLCIAAYGFLMLERLAGKKNAVGFQAPALPPTSGHVVLGPMHRHEPTSISASRSPLARVLARSLGQCPCCGRRRE